MGAGKRQLAKVAAAQQPQQQWDVQDNPQLFLDWLTPQLQPSAFVVMVGPPGAGKSTLAQQLQQQLPDSILVDQDQAWFDQHGDRDAARKQHVQALRAALTTNQPVIVDGLHLHPLQRASLLRLAQTYHRQTVAVQVHCQQQICIDRRAQRPQYSQERFWSQAQQLVQDPQAFDDWDLAVRAWTG